MSTRVGMLLFERARSTGLRAEPRETCFGKVVGIKRSYKERLHCDNPPARVTYGFPLDWWPAVSRPTTARLAAESSRSSPSLGGHGARVSRAALPGLDLPALSPLTELCDRYAA